jgi:hypothetical protein
MEEKAVNIPDDQIKEIVRRHTSGIFESRLHARLAYGFS